MKMSSVLIVESNPIDAVTIEKLLVEFNFSHLATVGSVAEAVEIINAERPELVLLDVFFDGAPKGLDLLDYLEQENIPAIITTGSFAQDIYLKSSEKEIVKGYLVKPFHKYTLASILMKALSPASQPPADVFFIKGHKNEQVRIPYDELFWLQADGDYCYLNTSFKRYAIKKSMVKILDELDHRFIRIHHSFAINSNHLETIMPSYVNVFGHTLPIGRTYKSGLKDKLHLLKNRKSKATGPKKQGVANTIPFSD